MAEYFVRLVPLCLKNEIFTALPDTGTTASGTAAGRATPNHVVFGCVFLYLNLESLQLLEGTADLDPPASSCFLRLALLFSLPYPTLPAPDPSCPPPPVFQPLAPFSPCILFLHLNVSPALAHTHSHKAFASLYRDP